MPSRSLTWGEFKALLAAANVPDSATIDYVDFSYPSIGADGQASITIWYNPDERHEGVVIS